MFARSRNIAIMGGNFTNPVLGITSAFEKLQKASAPSAFHNSSARFESPKCHTNTRVAILEYLMGWIFGRNDPEALILWLYGPAGAGKSAILQTLAERCFERRLLLASFFFGRSDPTRNTFKPLVATIAYQIATTIPEVKPYLESIIEHDPLIFDKSIATQLQSLVVDPLKALAASGFFNDANPWVRLVLIDGLDECDDPRMQSMILRALANMLRNETLPLIFLIASRPEQHITLTFNSSPLVGLWRSLVLDDSCKPDDDIRLFLEESFQEIRTTHPHRDLVPAVWPEASDVDKLIQKSSGQFVYASVVIKYVSAPIDRPHRRLEVIMGLRPTWHDLPFSELDALYMHILGSCIDPDIVLSILGFLITALVITNQADCIEFLLDLEPGDVKIALAPLASICHLPEKDTDLEQEPSKNRIYLYHASFGDFLADVSRSGPFYIDTLIVQENLVCKTLAILMDQSLFHDFPPSFPWSSLLEEVLQQFLPGIPLTERVESALNKFSLQQYWSFWVSMIKPQYYRSSPVWIVQVFLNGLQTNHSHSDYLTIYASHVSSFESVIKAELSKYCQNVELTSLAVIAMVTLRVDKMEKIRQSKVIRDALSLLVMLTEESIKFDRKSLHLLDIVWGDHLLEKHYPHLLIGPNKAAELCFNGDQHAQAALMILEFLCECPPHPIRYHQNYNKHQAPTSHSHRDRASGRPHYLLPQHIVARAMRVTCPGFARKRREKKHRYGIVLSSPHMENAREWFPYLSAMERMDCMKNHYLLGLLCLTKILERSSRSTELVDFILGHGKGLVFIPKETRKAIRAMHQYLDRANEDLDMVID